MKVTVAHTLVVDCRIEMMAVAMTDYIVQKRIKNTILQSSYLFFYATGILFYMQSKTNRCAHSK